MKTISKIYAVYSLGDYDCSDTCICAFSNESDALEFVRLANIFTKYNAEFYKRFVDEHIKYREIHQNEWVKVPQWRGDIKPKSSIEFKAMQDLMSKTPKNLRPPEMVEEMKRLSALHKQKLEEIWHEFMKESNAAEQHNSIAGTKMNAFLKQWHEDNFNPPAECADVMKYIYNDYSLNLYSYLEYSFDVRELDLHS